ncbi:MAG: ATP-dependent helicase/nuclease subunit A [bacterium]|nr:ATP-dependent helicase/nuclease subunit A [bacterium]
MRDPKTDLRAEALELIEELDLSRDLLDPAMEIVQAVLKSDLWLRALRSPERYAEIPFTLRMDSLEDGGVAGILRGVIDLVFREGEGWVIVDYKSNSVADREWLKQKYRPQLMNYSRAWEQATGERVVEMGLYLTHLGEHLKME